MNTSDNTRSLGSGIDVGLRNHMNRTYSIISGGLVLSAATAWIIGFSPLRSAVMTPEGGLSMLGMLGMWSPLILLVLAMFNVVGKTSSGARALYWAFAGLQGIGLSLVAIAVPPSAIVQALAVTAATFGAMSLYGYTTSRSLSAWGSFLFVGLVGIILASIVNIFVGSAALEFAISVIGVIVFAGLTAYDTQKLRDMYYSGLKGEELDHGRYWAALGLYLNILNLFNFFLSLGRE